MKVLIYGSTGMVGQAVLRECLLDPDVIAVQTIGRSASGRSHPKLEEVVQQDLLRYPYSADELRGYDACFFCLGISSNDVPEDEYVCLTYGLTTAVARLLAGMNPNMTFVYVSGTGTDSSERGPIMWARVKGKTENAIARLFPNAYMFRPGAIQPMHGEKSKTKSYELLYRYSKPILPVLRRLVPRLVIGSEDIGKAMIQVAKKGWKKRILENTDIRECAKSAAA